MDRNCISGYLDWFYSVALRKESVDRNGMSINGVSYDVWSLSARRAWIEMLVKFGLSLLIYRRSPQGERG